ncbi:MAG TPA: hypothetical protein PKW21_15765 [Rhabdaerophilum sp.]|nr:hypothetical protein [Rhabdaerophilum sp.]
MSATDKLAALKQKGFGAFSTPPRPEDAPQNLRKSEVIPELAESEMPPASDRTALETAAAGDLSAANDAPAIVRTRGRVRGAAKGTPKSTVREGFGQVNGRVPADVRLRILVASKVHGKDIGEIITEGFLLWEKKHAARDQ